MRRTPLNALIPGLLALLVLLSCQVVAPTPLPPAATTTAEVTALPEAAPTATESPKREPAQPPTATPTAEPTVAPTPQIAEGVSGEPTIGDPYAPELGNTGYDVQHYTLRLALDPAQVAVPAARVTIEAESTLADLAELTLDFIGFEIESVTVDGAPASFTRQFDKLLVRLPEAKDEGEPFSIEVVYSGKPVFERSKYVPFEDHQGLRFFPAQRQLYVVSEPDGSRYWFPCNDHPRDKALFSFELTVPEEMVAVANGQLVDTATELPNALPDGRAADRYTWEVNHPMAPYLATVAVANYVLVEGESPGGVPLRSYVFPAQQEYMERMTPVIGEALDWMAELFGPYPFDTFGFVAVNGLLGALETQEMVVIGSMDEAVMIHELAHMWFGDWVSLDSWGDMWRNEGFATYITAMWYGRDDPYILSREVRVWRNRFEGRSLYPLNNPQPNDLFGVEQYEGGALLVSELRREMGDEAFFASLRAYLEKYGGGTASHFQFKEVLELTADQNLDPLLDKWIKEE